ncbi:MAG: tetratricopeptide repeat protein [Ectothiorhodospiraceae bacterium]|nr:tetratricopeptide repeat protein [Ectothiorhodospiraceae bacterium]
MRLRLLRLLLCLLAPLVALPSQAQSVPGADERVEQAKRMVADGQLREAQALVEALLVEAPDHTDALLLKGVVLTRRGRAAEAIEVFEQLTREAPNLAEPYNNLAVLHAASGRYEEARRALTRAVELRADYVTAYENLGDVHARLALLAWDRAHDLGSGNARTDGKRRALAAMLDVPLNGKATAARAEAGAAAAAPSGAATQAAPTPETPRPPPTPTTTATADPAPAAAVAVAETAPPSPPTAAPGECRVLSERGRGDALKVAARWLGDAGHVVTAMPATEEGFTLHQVVIGPLDGAGAVEATIARLRGQGIKDFSRLGGRSDTLSLGVYRSEDSAQRRVQRLAALGLSADLRAREVTRAVQHVGVRSVGRFPAEETTRRFPAIEVSSAPCP